MSSPPIEFPKTAKLPKGEVTRQRILDAGEVVFAELGFAAARLEDVAQAVGIRRASIVYYFASKQELYDAVEVSIFSALRQQGRQRQDSSTDTLQQLQWMFDSWLDFMVARPTAARIILRNCADITPRASNPVEFSETTLEDLEAIVHKGCASGEFVAVEPMLVLDIVGAGILNYVCLAPLLGADRSYDPADPQRLEVFRGMLHRTLRALMCPPQPG
jgi:TetR/AcrR family transcriptional regulator